MNNDCEDFIDKYNKSRFLNEQEETDLIEVLKNLIKYVKLARHKGGYVIDSTPIKNNNGEIVGVTREYIIRLMQKVKQ